MTGNPKIWKNPVSLEPPGPRAHAPRRLWGREWLGLHKNVPSHTEVTPAINPESATTKTNELEQPLNLDTDSVFE